MSNVINGLMPTEGLDHTGNHARKVKGEGTMKKLITIVAVFALFSINCGDEDDSSVGLSNDDVAQMESAAKPVVKTCAQKKGECDMACMSGCVPRPSPGCIGGSYSACLAYCVNEYNLCCATQGGC